MSELEYRIRYSARAKRLILKVDPWGGIEVVAPQGAKGSAVTLFVSRHAQWLRDTRERVLARRTVPDAPGEVPESIELPALGERWQLQWRPEARGCRADPAHRRLVIGGADEAELRRRLQQWLQRQAVRHLLPWLAEVAQESGIDYAQAGVRSQRTRWGSCNSRGHISLNRNLLFLAPDVVRYLLVHELCHIREPNHSPRFWALVAALMPDYARYDRVLRRGWEHVPAWAWPG